MHLKSVLCLILSLLITTPAYPCTRVLWEAKSSDVIVGRNMDWAEDTMSNFWLLPRGIERNGLTADNPLKWTSKYGSVVISAYDLGTADGLNEKGLTVNLLYLTETKFPLRDPIMPGLAVSLWPQYYLDNFATVAEAVTSAKKQPFQVQTAGLDTAMGRKEGTVHIAISDKTGDSAVLEYIDGKLKIYHDKSYKVMTNSPSFDQQLAALNQYKGFGGNKNLPGSTEAADRFVRAAYYSHALPQPKDYREAIAGVLSVLRNTSQPFGTPDPARPYISTTRWRTVADLTRGIYFYENVLSPNIVWVDFSKLNFTKGQSAKKISLIKNFELLMTGKSKIYLSHLPMFHSPHDYQAILMAEIDPDSKAIYQESLKSSSETVYTLVPEAFVLPDMVKNPKPFLAQIYQGHFERGGKLIAAQVTVTIQVIYFKKFDSSAVAPNFAEYILFGNAQEMFLAHVITTKPDHDQVVKISPTADLHSILPESGSITLTSTDQKNDVALTEGQNLSVNAFNKILDITITENIYLETADLSF